MEYIAELTNFPVFNSNKHNIYMGSSRMYLDRYTYATIPSLCEAAANFNVSISEPIVIDNRDGQGEILAPTLFSIYFAVDLTYVFQDCQESFYLRFTPDTTGQNTYHREADHSQPVRWTRSS